jgi:hypothetical protein
MSDGIWEVGPNDNEIGLRVNGGSQTRDRNTDEARFSLSIKSDQDLNLSERKEILSKLIGMEFAVELEEADK